MTAVLAVEGLRKAYGPIEALRDVDLVIEEGEIVGLLGPNGAGKTTLVSVVAGLVRPDAGSVRVGRIDCLRHPREARRLIGLAPQETGVYPLVRVYDNLLLFGRLAGLPRAALRRRIEEVGEALDLARLFGRPARLLSTGERRRLHTATALLHRPPLLLLDEPTVGADVHARRLLLGVVRDLSAQGSAICYSTHYLPEVEALGASVAILDGGRIIGRGPIGQLVAAHSRTTVQITFDGPAPAVPPEGDCQRDGSVLRVPVRDAATSLTPLLVGLGPDVGRVRSVEVVEPGLEGVFLALTGRRYA